MRVQASIESLADVASRNVTILNYVADVKELINTLIFIGLEQPCGQPIDCAIYLLAHADASQEIESLADVASSNANVF